MNWKVINLPCGHTIEEKKRYCPSCHKIKVRIKHKTYGKCPECDKTYKTDEYGAYMGDTAGLAGSMS